LVRQSIWRVVGLEGRRLRNIGKLDGAGVTDELSIVYENLVLELLASKKG
jgi:hypothetical protein